MAKDNAKRIAHPQEGRGHGPLSVREPMLRYLGWNSGYEGTCNTRDALAYHRHPVLVAFREKLRNPRECAEAAEEAPDPGEVSSDLDPGLEAPGLDEVGGDETCRDPGGVAHGGDQVQLLARHVIIRRSLHTTRVKTLTFILHLQVHFPLPFLPLQERQSSEHNLRN